MNQKVIALTIAGIIVIAGVVGALLLTQNNAKAEVNLTSVALDIYGNADGDSNIDEADAKLVENYISASSTSNSTEMAKFEADNHFNSKLADANKDGKIDGADATQIRAVVNKDADTLWFVDGAGADRSVSLNISRIGAEYYANTELCLILGLADKIVAVDNAPYVYKDFYFTATQQANITNLVNMNTPDYAFVNDLDLDVLLTFYTNSYDVKQTKLIGTDVIYLGLYNPDMANAEGSNFIQGILKAGYIFGAVDRAEEYAAWILETRNKLADIANSIPEDEKPTVLMSNYPNSYFINPDTKTATVYCFTDPLGQACLLGGGKNVGASLYGGEYNNSLSKVSQVDALFNDDNSTTIDYIFLHMVKYTYAGTVVAGVPEHGYLAQNESEVAASWESATSSSHTLLVDTDPNDLYLIAGDFRNGPTGAVLLGAYIGKIINPSHYTSIDPIALHNYYINHFLGIADYDVSTDGVFMYHPVA
ncbi:MAG: dockerin type I domain-containing protein [Methanomassiliicoccus sp.]|nr:dockerin type I domain-containing protein [Methanomassiliicoccus sp.]